MPDRLLWTAAGWSDYTWWQGLVIVASRYRYD
jgi:hypothetical protein